MPHGVPSMEEKRISCYLTNHIEIRKKYKRTNTTPKMSLYD